MQNADTLLFARHYNAESSRRLSEQLKKNIEEGIDLGPRGHHIRSINASIEAALPELFKALEELRPFLPSGTLEEFVRKTGIEQLVQNTSALIAASRDFPVD